MNRRNFISAAIAFAAAAVAGVPKVFGRRPSEVTTCCAHEIESPALAEYHEARQMVRLAKARGTVFLSLEAYSGPAVYINPDGTVTTTPDDSKVCIGRVVEYNPSTKVATVRL